jgi:hypothetical protein
MSSNSKKICEREKVFNLKSTLEYFKCAYCFALGHGLFRSRYVCHAPSARHFVFRFLLSPVIHLSDKPHRQRRKSLSTLLTSSFFFFFFLLLTFYECYLLLVISADLASYVKHVSVVTMMLYKRSLTLFYGLFFPPCLSTFIQILTD